MPRTFLVIALAAISAIAAAAQSSSIVPAIAATDQKIVHISQVSKAPRLEDFESMQATGVAKEMVKVSGFIQQQPSDGAPSTQQTDVYLGYDTSNLYAAWICFDDPTKVQAHLSRRENIVNDDWVELTVDTFHDQRHGFVFESNPLGVQNDGLWEEPNGADFSFDTVRDTHAELTSQGYIVLMVIPFRSLRFPSGPQEWGFTLLRTIQRNNESDYWPRVSSRIAGRLNQAGVLTGLEGISPPRNYQFNPYGFFRSFRALDDRDPANPSFDRKTAQFKGGLDSKFIFHNSMVLDATINPDFSQVESDQPQNTVNQRFEVFFPEKRPFFLENSNLFEPSNFNNTLVFTRRILDPEYGVRLTGKEGPYTLAFLVTDDRGPGEIVADADPEFQKRAYFAIARLSRDLGGQSNIGLLYVDREFFGGWNRIGGVDGLWKFRQNWTLAYRGVVSSTKHTDGSYAAGPYAEASLSRQGRQLNFGLQYQDVAPGFETQTGFVLRNDIRHVAPNLSYSFRPEGKHLISWGPGTTSDITYDHSGTVVEYSLGGKVFFELSKQTSLITRFTFESDTLRPKDFPGLAQNAKFSQDGVSLSFNSQPRRWLQFSTNISDGGQINVVPPAGQLPVLANDLNVNQTISLTPIARLQIDNTYILDRLKANHGRNSAFNNQIYRSKWNYQFTQALSLRVIVQYNNLLANPLYTSLETTKNMNFDFLLTYLVHPGTAVYVGYNSNLENLDPALCSRLSSGSCDPSNPNLLRTPDSFINDGRQFYVKVSYLFRP